MGKIKTDNQTREVKNSLCKNHVNRVGFEGTGRNKVFCKGK